MRIRIRIRIRITYRRDGTGLIMIMSESGTGTVCLLYIIYSELRTDARILEELLLYGPHGEEWGGRWGVVPNRTKGCGCINILIPQYS